MYRLPKFILLLIFCNGVWGETLQATDKCTCDMIISLTDCQTVTGCGWNYTTSQCLKSSDLPATQPAISVLCSGLSSPETQCRLTVGCAYIQQNCIQFAGCASYLKTTNDDCQAINSQCTTDGTRFKLNINYSCINIKECKDYSQTLCPNNTSSSGSKKCVWDSTNNICRDQICSEAPNTYNTDQQCNNFKNGCVTNGYGCADTLGACATFTTDCDKYVGTDGYCEAGEVTCKPKSCASAPDTTITDADCEKFQKGCVTTGKGCYQSPLLGCSTYSSDCESMIGNEGKCATVNGACAPRECTQAQYASDKECKDYKSDCLSDGVKCVTSLSLCSSYSGTIEECIKYKGSDGLCTRTDAASAGECRTKLCSEAPSNYILDTQCSAYQTGCVSNGLGCVSSRAACSTYTSNCDKYVGSDGKCTSPPTGSSSTNCVVLACSMAPTTYVSNKECTDFLSGCVSTGGGCQVQKQCELSQKEVTCNGTSNCYWSGVCVSNQCTNLNNIAQCNVNSKCQWNGSACVEISCATAPTTLKTNDECQQFRNGCVTTYAGCISSDAPCSSYSGDYATCNKYVGNGKICSRGSTGTGSCNDRQCSDNTIATSTTECDQFMTGCLSKGTGCIDPAQPCTSYTGTQAQCLLFRGEKGVKKCSNDGTASTQCRNATCSDDNTDTTDAACSSFLSGCVTKGNGCIESTAPCSSFSGQNTSQCGAYKAGACWWVSGASCVDRQCVHQDSATTDSECTNFLSGCMFNGIKGCIVKSSACSVFTGDEAKCQSFYGNYTQCTRKDACANKVCAEKIDATSQSDCMNYTSGCRYNGTSTCIDSQSLCTNYNIANADVCQNITDSNGNKCWSGTTTCVARICSQLASSASQAICDAFLSGCVFTGTACATKSGSCTSYLNFTQDACKAASRVDGLLCWKEASEAGTCEERQCTNTLTAYSESSCLSHLSTCVYTGTACTAKQVSCSSYLNFTQDACKSVKNTAGELCWRSSTTSAPCQDRTCSDTLTTTTAVDCANHKNTCKYNGSICVDTQSSCSNYTSFTQEACQNVTQSDGAACWKADATIGNCVLRTCALAPTVFRSSTACPQFLSTCRYNGSACVDQQSTCASYTAFTQDACRSVSTSTGKLCWMTAAGPGACIDRACTDTISSPSASVCSNYLITCRYSGSACVAQEAACSSYADFSESACQEATDSSGGKCWSTTSAIGPCKSRACTDTVLNPNPTTCNAHLTGCIFDNASACVQGQSSCTGYTTACKTVKTTSGGLCWTNSVNPGNCKARECSDNTDAINDETCDSFLSGCVTNGKGCVSKSTTCAQFTGTSQGCLGYTGNGIRCKGGVSTTGVCSQRYCNDNTSATTDAECSAFMSGCVTNLKGCISSNESCSSYYGTQATCAKFTGGGKKCWNVASATNATACTIRKCEDNTTATTDSECSNFQTQCVTNLRGCLPSTSPCTAFTGTYAQCIQFTGNGVKCSNDATATSTQSCKARECSHNTIATTDSECNSFLSGCVTTLRGCVVPQACSLFVGTAEQCSKFSATDKPCTGGSVSGACYKLICSSAPNTYITDLQCQQFKSGCVTNGKGCVDSSTCEEIQSSAGCSGRSGCLYIPSCRTIQASCSTLATPSICVSTPILTGRCTWANNVCRNWECQDAPASNITHGSCQLLNKSCTTTGYGCINMSTCSTYTSQYVCSIAHTIENGETCVWDSVSCRAKKCEDAPKSYSTDTLCEGFIGSGSGCKTTGYGCVTPPFSCSQLVVRSKCTYDSANKPCLWFPNRTVKCEQYAQCTDIAKTTYAECQEYSAYCTTDGATCIPLSSCENYSSQSACTTDIAGDKCGWLKDKCVKYTQCASAELSDNSQCQAYSQQCVSDGSKCIEISTCDKFATQVACSNTGSDGRCIWENNSCRVQKCEDALVTTYSECQSFISTCTLNSTQNGCIPIASCTTYSQINCIKGTEGKCFWTGEACKVFACSDLRLYTTAECQAQDSSCISMGTNCISKGLCSSYVTQIACNSGGTDGACAFINAECKLMSSCSDAGPDSIACKQKSQYCQYVSNSCQDHTCTSIASGGSCNPLINFAQTTVTICAQNQENTCVESEGQYLSSSTCLSLSNWAYSWNPINNTCHKCNNYVSNNGTNNNNNNTNNSTSSTHGSIILLTIVILVCI